MSSDYNTWLKGVLLTYNEEQYDNKLTINQFVARFNCEVAENISQYGQKDINKAIMYIYSSSGYGLDALDQSLNEHRIVFMDSIKQLYTKGFSKYCAHHYGHLDAGPEKKQPLNQSCYMLWDMGGLECPALSGEKRMLEATMELLSFILSIDHPACQESALHGLGHLASKHEAKVSPIIRDYLKKMKPNEVLQTYASSAMSGRIQ